MTTAPLARRRDWRRKQLRLDARAVSATLIAVALSLSGSQRAQAKDVTALADLLTPAYTAMNFAVVCARRDAQFLLHPSGPRGSAINYAEHVKDEAIASLPHDDALAVLKSAADGAHALALQTLRRLNSTDPAIEAAAIKAWCATEASNFIRAFIDDHDTDHHTFLQQLKKAKQ